MSCGINILKGELKYTDNELLDGIKLKNTIILQFIMKDNFLSIKQMVLLNGGSESDADDILQESLIVLYRKIREDNFILTCSLKTYLYSVARLKWLKELKRKQRVEMLTDEEEYMIDETDSIEDEIENEERQRIYREKYEELGEDCKKVLKLSVTGTSIAEITEIMGYSSEQHTRNRRFKCKETLIQKIRNTKLFNELGNENNRND